jgi:hypothetical protein
MAACSGQHDWFGGEEEENRGTGQGGLDWAGLVRPVCFASWARKCFGPEAIQRKLRFFLFYLDSIHMDSIRIK